MTRLASGLAQIGLRARLELEVGADMLGASHRSSKLMLEQEPRWSVERFEVWPAEAWRRVLL